MQYSNFWLTVLDPVQHSRTCDYWYVISSNAMSHTAFRTEHGLTRWLNERGLKLTAELTEPGTWSAQRLAGEYRDKMHMSMADFDALNPIIVSKAASNGQYVVAKITQDDDGFRTVHTLNPNVRDRQMFDWFKTNQEMN